MKRKSIKLISTTLLLSTMLSFSSLAAWEQSEAGWKYKDDNTQQYVTARWIESATEQGVWYYLNEQGIMAVNTLIDNQYYVNEAGEWRDTTGGSNTNIPDNSSNNGISWGDPNETGGTSGGFREGVIVG